VWEALVAVWAARLSRPERIAILYAAIHAIHQDDLEPSLEEALGGDGAGEPPSPWHDVSDVLDEAATWAMMASDDERRSYALAALSEMPTSERSHIAAMIGHRAA
ncbi:MAG TPA: hypothetical protein VFJ13_06455, partial [Paracoccaceae bacterium]|nr:hypothetical protein [Paracoccaceae bacterium]